MIHEHFKQPRPPAKSAYISARVTSTERALLDALARDLGATVSELVRYLAVKGARHGLAQGESTAPNPRRETMTSVSAGV